MTKAPDAVGNARGAFLVAVLPVSLGLNQGDITVYEV
jgi:hypothetical protein